MNRQILTLLGLGAFATATYAILIEPNKVILEEIAVRMPRLAPAFDGYRLVQISDFHLRGQRSRRHLLAALEKVQQIQADLIVITGDLLHGYTPGDVEFLIEALRPLHAPDGVLAVLGNHDYRDDVTRLRQALPQCDVVELCNSVHSIQRGEAALHIAGLGSAVWRQDSLDTVLDKLPDQGAAILLAHEPDTADFSAATGRFDLQLSGHTHGGQVHLPLIGMPVLPSFGQRYPSGRYQLGDMTLYTNRGLGTTGPLVRLGAPPEVSLITLQAAG